ncbi:hypothetical protein [Mycobacteroides abscessus]|uniref:hypothetical protein n=2 Tax=Mycobacteroides abscessus TaxID=36809 RepID=UPI0003868B3D|nr:hypothetical protein [Mycobacteroides abscessus]EPZ18404.1 hypothetical protein M879_21550 [Mycobacteroides abscessus V06705]MBN7548430.1 hypothetical protein [Mycobacteroides abscessus subsp. abscessus]MDM2692248.1 hypothetical protein [Mycobacteroides abscessus]MDO3265659.1 hypothetical protein [Mycobacteroides abscessus subsp. abscessus]PVB39063.1 hypothetical protein DDJ91_12495 [Mycobacteroides abscessus]
MSMHWVLALPFFSSALLQFASAWVGSILSGRTDQKINDLLSKKLGEFDIKKDDGKIGGKIMAGTAVNDLRIEGLTAQGIRNEYAIEKDSVTAVVSFPALIAPLLLSMPNLSTKVLSFLLVVVAVVTIGIVVLLARIDPTKYRTHYKLRLSPAGLAVVAFNTAVGILLLFGLIR